MHFPRLYSFLQTLKDPGVLQERRRLRSRVRMFLDTLPEWRQASHLVYLGSGSYAVAYSFVLRGKNYVIRISRDSSSFSRDSFISQCTHSIPVPHVFAIGEFGRDGYYAISERVGGRPISLLPMKMKLKVVPMMFESLVRLHHTEVSNAKGYGVIDHEGNGISPSWKEFLMSYKYYRKSAQWDRDIHGTCLDRNLFDHCLNMMVILVPFCLEERFLVHGDFSFQNVLSDGKRITGIVDWAYCSYGDALFDFASCSFWHCNSLHGKAWMELGIQTLCGVEHFDERVRCYMLKSAIGGLLEAARMHNVKKYEYRTSLVKQLLKMVEKPAASWYR